MCRSIAAAGILSIPICSLVAASGCGREGIESQTVAKSVERVPAADSIEEKPDAGVPGTATSERPWTAPPGWAEDPAPKQMRLATYIAPDAAGPVEVAVTRFGGRVGGDLANINRWRGQMGLPPIGEAELEGTLVRFAAPGFDGYETQIGAVSGVMLAAGVYDEAADRMWFGRATVPDAEVADRIRPDVFNMARSIAGLEGGD